MKIVLHSLLVSCLFIACSPAKEIGEVHIYGTISGAENGFAELLYDGTAAAIGNSRDITLKIDAQGYFDTTILLSKPEYFRLNRNTLYLSPGDDLQCQIPANSFEASFSGRGSVANTYMKKRLFPKGGSYLESGRAIKGNFSETRKHIHKQAQQRREELQSLQGVSDEFKAMENARIAADVLNSYFAYPGYNWQEFYSENPQIAKQRQDTFYQSIFDEVCLLLKQIDNEICLNVAVVRDVLLEMLWEHPDWVALLKLDMEIFAKAEELSMVYKIVKGIQEQADKESLREANQCLGQLQDQALKNELEFAIAQVQMLMPGKEAIDFELYTQNGEKIKLSQLKGKYLYLDFWATWCGPCVYESPFFEKLAKEFKDENIEFLSISTDSEKEAWLKYLDSHPKSLPQYISQDLVLTEKWNIRGIPRFVLIDKNFKIINANAPRPSSPEITEYLHSILNED